MAESAPATSGTAAPPVSRRRLRFMTCGSVDDGKSTLIGRLLHDSGAIFEDHLSEALKAGGSDVLDFSFLVDGLKAEREQGITIDVAYRYFMTSRRAFLIADAPGHEQYTRNQAAAASQTELAIVLISAAEGIKRQTRRHMAIAAMFGVRDIVLAVNKMDLTGWDEGAFDAIVDNARALADRLGQKVVAALPLSARSGGNVTAPTPDSPWYKGPTLIDVLESFTPADAMESAFVMPVQAVARLDGGGRLLLGEVKSGTVTRGQMLRAADGLEVKVEELWTAGVPATVAGEGDPVALRLLPERDFGRGVVLMGEGSQATLARQLRTRLVVLDEGALQSGRAYEIHLGTANSVASLSRIEGIVDLDHGTVSAPDGPLRANEIAVARLTLARPLACQPFSESRTLGAFILVERATGITAAAGVVLGIEQAVADVPWQTASVMPADRSKLTGQTPIVYWLTGLSGSGKSTIATLMDRKLFSLGRQAVVLDGDNLRHGLNNDLGFSESDRIENMRRVSHVASLMADAGLVVIVSLISPYAAERARAREVVGASRFLEVFVDAPLSVCAERDPKGHYQRAAAGKLAQFTGIASGYEAPTAPDVHLQTDAMSPEQAVLTLLDAGSRVARQLRGEVDLDDQRNLNL